MGFPELFSPKNIILDLQATAKSDLLAELVDRLVETKTLEASLREKVLASLNKREELGSTGIGHGVGIPHAKVPELKRVHAAIGIAREGVEYRAVDGEPVHIAIMILRPDQEVDDHLKFLQWISRLGRNSDFRSFMRQAKSAEDVVGLLEEMSGV